MGGCVHDVGFVLRSFENVGQCRVYFSRVWSDQGKGVLEDKQLQPLRKGIFCVYALGQHGNGMCVILGCRIDCPHTNSLAVVIGTAS